jgi:LPS export ABC transporter protein LptC
MRPAAQRTGALTRRAITSLAIVAGAWLAYGLLARQDDEEIGTTATEDQRGYYLTKATLTEMGPDGAPRTVLRAARVEQQLSDQTVLLSDLEVDYTTAQAGAWTVTADRGRLLRDATSLLLSGDVVIRGTESRGSAVIRTDQLTYDTTTSLVQTAEPVSVQFGQHRLEGRGLRVALNEGTLRLESNVHGLFKP